MNNLIFTSGLDSGFLGAGVLIVMNSSLVKHVCKAGEINSLIAKAVNESSFVVLGGDFNEDGSHKCASFKKCFDLSLINSFGGSSFVKSPTWCNSHDITKTLDYVFISSNLVNVVVDCGVNSIEDYFNTNHKAVYVSAELGGLLDVSFWFHKLELLVSKLVKASWLVSGGDFALLLNTWIRLDSVSTSPVKSMFLSGTSFNAICSGLVKTKKFYCFSKLLESKHAEESCVRQAIERRMKSFEMDKGHTIRSVLERLFCKVVLDHLVDGRELVLEPELVKSKINGIMESWTRKRVVASNISGDWARQFRSLDHVFNGAFFDVMYSINFDEMFGVISNLFDGKVAGLSSITNELWKHCDKSVLDMLLVFLNFCLGCELVPRPWREVWVSMIPKPYEWEGVLTNTHPIALIETACKILSDRISLACSKFDVLCKDNFSVLKSTTTQSLIFAVGFVIKNALKKNRQEAGDTGLTSFLAAGAFVDDMIWVDNSQSATQHILNVASDFFRINDISINNEKTVAIPINCQVVNPTLNISGLPISVAKKGEPHLSAVLVPIVSYRIQFSFVPTSVYNKWDALIHKSLKFKSGLPLNFPNDALYHPSLYGLKTFEQIQAENMTFSSISLSFLDGSVPHNILQFCEFGVVSSSLLNANSNHLSVYTDGSLCGLRTCDMKASTAVFFEDINMGLGVSVSGLVSFTLAELQAIALALECVPSLSSVDLFLDSQAALDACVSESVLFCPDFRNWCWIECRHIANIIRHKWLNINWVKVKDHSGIMSNECTNEFAKTAVFSDFYLPSSINEWFLKAGSTMVSGSSRHFVHDVFQSIYRVGWEVNLGSQIILSNLHSGVDWFRSFLVWHPNSHLAAGFTSKHTANCQTYFMKALHHQLFVAVRKHLYNKCYSSVICLYCGDVEVSNHVFSCSSDVSAHAQLVDIHASAWKAHTGFSRSSSCVV
ncbi:hypothetical protein G9A89_019971 [Geosiphon pyriformis]|nr:hypothetical protein G9A89_019971 [Geosiphon pyriformis]